MKGIGEVRAAANIKKNRVEYTIIFGRLGNAEVDVPYAVVKNLLDTEAIRDVPYQCGETTVSSSDKASLGNT